MYLPIFVENGKGKRLKRNRDPSKSTATSNCIAEVGMTSFRFARHMACILSTSHWGGKEAGIKGGAGWLGLWLEVCSELGSPACACLVLKMLEWHDHDGKYSGQRERYVTRSGLGNPIPSIFHSLNVMKFLSALNDQGCVPPCHTSSQRDWRCSWFAHRRRQLPTSQSSNISDERAAAITWTTTFVPLNWCHPRKNSIAAKQIYNPWVGCKTHELAQHHAFLRLFICCSQEVAWTPDRSAQSCLDFIQSPPSCSLQY